ncbi:hypothetical protein EP331_04890 [bacterium]|nr:MAG: hypothetical protein EP331_04890 [bacterium]
MRILKFLSVYLAFALFIFLLVIGWNWKEFTTVFDNSDALTDGQEFVEQTFSLGGMADFIRDHPEYVSVYSTSLHSDSAQLSIEANTPRTLGSLSSALLALHYVYAVQKQELNPETLVSMDSIAAYQLPNHYRTAQEKSVSWLNEHNYISNNQVSLENLVRVAIEYNSLAVHDYLLTHFGVANIQANLQELGLRDSLYLLPFSGLAIQLHPHILGGDFQTRFSTLKNLTGQERAQEVFTSTHSFIHNSAFREKVLNAFNEYESGIGFVQEKQSFDVFPQLSAKQLVQLFQSAITGTVLSKDSKTYLLNLLNWPMTDRTYSHLFHYYGGVFENKMSLASGIDIAFSKERQDTVVQAVFFDQIPIALWFHMSSKYIHQDYQRRIVWDQELRDRSLHKPSKSVQN